MNRRGFLAALGGAAAGLLVDPEKLLWKPGEKLISIPKPLVLPPPRIPQKQLFSVDFDIPDQVLAFDSRESIYRRYIVPAMQTLAERLDHEAAKAGTALKFERLEIPTCVDRAFRMSFHDKTGQPNKEMRVMMDYDILDCRHVGRVDALVEL